MIRTSIQNRYTLLSYYYSQFWNINENGGSFFKPLFFEFPSDAKSYDDIEINMMLGDGLKASVETRRLEDGSTDFYFPEGTWCQILPYVHAQYDQGCFTGGQTKSMQTNKEDYYVHLRNGHILTTQNATEYQTMNTKE